MALGFCSIHVNDRAMQQFLLGGTLNVAGLKTMNSRSCPPGTHVQRAVSEMVGASEETGGVFDPLGLATDEVRGKWATSFAILSQILVGGDEGAVSVSVHITA